MSRKTKIVVAIVAVIAIAAIAVIGYCYRMDKASGGDEIIKIGAILPLTGAQAVDGQELRDSILLAVDTVNSTKKKSSHELKLLIEDSQLSAKVAMTLYNKIKGERPRAIIVGGSTIAQALAPLAEKDKIPLLCLLSSDDELPKIGGWVFRIFPSDREEIVAMCKFVERKLNIKSIYIFCVDNIQGVTANKYINSAFSKQYSILGTHYFNINGADAKAIVANAMSKKPDAFYIFGYGIGYCACFNIIREMGFSGPILTWDPMSLDFYQKSVKRSKYDIFYTGPNFSQDYNLAGKNLYNSYHSKYKKIPGFITSFGYEAILMLNKALLNAEKNNSDLRTELLKYSSANSSTGEISFDSYGGLVSTPSIFSIRDGKVKKENL